MQNPAAKPIDRARIRGLIFDVDGTLADTDDNMAYKIESVLKPVHGLFKPGQAQQFSRRFVHFSEGPMNWILNVADRIGIDSWLAYLLDWRAKARYARAQQIHSSPADSRCHPHAASTFHPLPDGGCYQSQRSNHPGFP